MMLFQKRADSPIVPLPPPPRVLSTTGSYDGNDGRWSTFYINIAGDGDGEGQNFKILPSTSWMTTIIPQKTDWCPDESCAKARGILSFKGQQALGLEISRNYWKTTGTYSLPWPIWWSNETMTLNSTRGPGELYVETTVGLDKASPASIAFQEQYVVSYVAKDFFLGFLGLAVGQLSLTTAKKNTFFSTFAASKRKGLDIPSASYGYTAGAYYKNDDRGIEGSMVFGGYDQSRVFRTQGTSISMPNEKNNTLLVGVQSILYQPNQSNSAQTQSFTSPSNGGASKGFYAIIDSTVPYLVLPNDLCDRFAEEFQLTYDRSLGLYTVNDTAHEFNIQQEATVIFKIGSTATDSSDYTVISLPYAAFDLQLGYPIVPTAINYFPIRRGNNGPYVLGRTFLQEAYIIVDYERTNFTVAPAAFPDRLKENLIPIFNTSYVPPVSEGKPPSSGLSAGAIAGIVVGIIAVFLLLGVAAFFFWRRRRNAKANVYAQEDKPSEIDTTVAGGEIKYRRISELTGSEAPFPPGTTIGGTYYGTDPKKYPAIAEMSPESQPAELYSPPLGGDDGDYFAGAPRPRRRGATRGSSGHNTPGTPVAELAGDFGQYEAAGPTQRPQHARSPSDTSLSTNIDEVLAGNNNNNNNEPQVQRKGSSRFVEHTGEDGPPGPSRAEQVVSPLEDPLPAGTVSEHHSATDRRPSHSRGPSDTTINSESTAVSQPTPEELQRWATHAENGPRRPLSQ